MFKMTKRVFEQMQSCHILPDNSIFHLYFLHQKKELKQAKSKDIQKTNVASRKEARDTAREAAQTTQQAQQTKEYLLFRKEEQLLDTNSKLCRQISYSLNFRKRTFKTKKILHKVTVEQVRLKLEEECQECKGQLLASQLRKAIQRAISEVN